MVSPSAIIDPDDVVDLIFLEFIEVVLARLPSSTITKKGRRDVFAAVDGIAVVGVVAVASDEDEGVITTSCSLACFFRASSSNFRAFII